MRWLNGRLDLRCLGTSSCRIRGDIGEPVVMRPDSPLGSWELVGDEESALGVRRYELKRLRRSSVPLSSSRWPPEGYLGRGTLLPAGNMHGQSAQGGLD